MAAGGRFLKKNADWFPLYTNVRNRREIKYLVKNCGPEGYGVLLMLMQSICEDPKLFIKISPFEIKLLAEDFNLNDPHRLNIIIQVCVEANLLSKRNMDVMVDHYDLYSPLLEEFLSELFEKRMRDAKRKQDEYERNKQKGIKKSRKKKEPEEPPIPPSKPDIHERAEEQELILTGQQAVLIDIPEKTHELQDFINAHCPNIKKIQTQITLNQCERILKKYPDPEFIKRKLRDMENRKGIAKDYMSVYLTLDSWCERDWTSNNMYKNKAN